MRNLLSSQLLLGLLAIGAAGCSGGGTDPLSTLTVRCGGGEAFCLISCDLGCNQTGCAVTEIAENQRLRFVFSERLAVSSVNDASVSIRTPSGVRPDGDLMVSDRELVFVPRVRTVNGVSTFGFQRNESYVITLGRSANGQGIRSASGDGLEREFSCTVIASRGIQDEDQQPPQVTLVSPVDLNSIPNQPTIVLRFSELIDTTALQGTLTANSPINFIVRGTLDNAGVLICDPDSSGVAIEGTPTLSTERVGANDVTVVTFSSPLPLPSSACLTVNVTADLRDLSGRQGLPAVFDLFTSAGSSQPIPINESFASTLNQDLDTSGPRWNQGARPGLLGGDGRHGSFDVTLGTLLAGEYEWSTDLFTIPANRTLSGVAENVTDGKFYFSDFILPAGVTMRWKGSVAPQVFVRGKVEILGTIKINAADMPFWTPTTGFAANQRVQDFNGRGTPPLGSGFIVGQSGSIGGAGGGRGGQGGNECALNGPLAVYNGQPGQDVQVPAGHAYAAQAVGTGGRGSPLAPTTGLTVTFPLLQPGNFRAQFSPGGSGGGFSGPGGTAAVTPLGVTVIGLPPVAGNTFNLVPLPAPLPVGFTSLDHFVVGGSGGGGGGSHAFGTTITSGFDVYMAGSGGSGGGGAMALRAGGDLTVAASARLEAKGGAGVLITGDDRTSVNPDANWGVTSPGGGGSGGSFLLQAGRNLVVNGTIDTSGGAGSRTGQVQSSVTLPPTLAPFSINSQAGAGANGFYRLEAGILADFNGSGVPTFDPALHTGALTDRDERSGSASKWLTSGQLFPPTWLRYELDVDIDGLGVITTFTDSGAPGTQKANDPAGAVTILFQGAQLNQAGTAPAPGAASKPWREGIGTGAGPGIAIDSPTGFRFLLTFNGAMFPNCVVRALRVFAQS